MVKSFELDHLNMKAPNIRVSDTIEAGEHKIVKYDVRFKIPYVDTVMDGASMHTIEHLIATTLREVSKVKIIDFSPMGCKTGFYLTVLDPTNDFIEKDILQAFSSGLQYDEVPGNAKEQCGNYTYHNLALAKEELTLFIKHFYEEDR